MHRSTKMKGVAIAALTAFMPLAAAAQTNVPGFDPLVSDPNRLMFSFSVEEAANIVTELGWQHEIIESGDVRGVAVSGPDDVNFVMIPTVCFEAGNCVGLVIGAAFPPAPLRTVNEFDLSMPFINAAGSERETILSRYEICDGGYTRGNLAYVLTNFHGASKYYGSVMSQKLVDTDPDAVLADYSADMLNRRTGAGVPVAFTGSANAAAHHRAASSASSIGEMLGEQMPRNALPTAD